MIYIHIIDIKLENVLFDQTFTLKLADFGFATTLAGKYGTGVLTTYKGTPVYMAPELNEKKNYTGIEVDLFASAVLLFIMRFAKYPFNKAVKQDKYYRYIY